MKQITRKTEGEENIILKTRGVCPVCNKAVPAVYFAKEGKVYFRSECPSHGGEALPAGTDPEFFRQWLFSPVNNVPPRHPVTQNAGLGCPHSCGTCEGHLQTACCVVLDVTGRCNQHCPYCFASAGDAGDDPDLETLLQKMDLLIELGEEKPFNLQLSGGEPTLREDLPLIAAAARGKGFSYIQLNTNGRRIAREKEYAGILREAGISVVFLQFDGTRDGIYTELRNEPLLAEKKQAIEHCRRAGLPVALVPTMVEGVNMDNIGEMLDFLLENVDIVKGIHFQPVAYFGRHPNPRGRVSMFDVLDALAEQDSRFDREDFAPIATGHPLCCFYGTFLKDGETITCLSPPRGARGVTCDCSLPGVADEVIRKDRDFVLNKWAADKDGGKPPAEGLTGMDAFLAKLRGNSFTLSGMAFQETGNMDADRLKRCRVQVLSGDNRLIPFCAYQGIYREKEKNHGATR